jgi:hypothetical protein
VTLSLNDLDGNLLNMDFCGIIFAYGWKLLLKMLGGGLFDFNFEEVRGLE